MAGTADAHKLTHMRKRMELGGTRDFILKLAQTVAAELFDVAAGGTMQESVMTFLFWEGTKGITTVAGMPMNETKLIEHRKNAVDGDRIDRAAAVADCSLNIVR